MARKAKRLLALLLALLLCVSLLPATALAEGEDEETGTIALVDGPGEIRPGGPAGRGCGRRYSHRRGPFSGQGLPRLREREF